MSGEACLPCGYYPTRAAEAIVFQNGDLSLYDRRTGTTRQTSDPQEQLRWHAQLACIALQRGYKPGWAAHKFKEKFGHWPPRISANSGGAVARSARVGAQPDNRLGQIQTGRVRHEQVEKQRREDRPPECRGRILRLAPSRVDSEFGYAGTHAVRASSPVAD